MPMVNIHLSVCLSLVIRWISMAPSSQSLAYTDIITSTVLYKTITFQRWDPWKKPGYKSPQMPKNSPIRQCTCSNIVCPRSAFVFALHASRSRGKIYTNYLLNVKRWKLHKATLDSFACLNDSNTEMQWIVFHYFLCLISLVYISFIYRWLYFAKHRPITKRLCNSSPSARWLLVFCTKSQVLWGLLMACILIRSPTCQVMTLMGTTVWHFKGSL